MDADGNARRKKEQALAGLFGTAYSGIYAALMPSFARQLAVALGVLHEIGLLFPCLVGLAHGLGAGRAAVHVPVAAAARGYDDVAVPEVGEEARRAQRVHAAGDDRRGRLHAVPFLVEVRAVGRVALQHVGDGAVGRLALHLAEAHGAGMDTGRAEEPRHLAEPECGVTALGLRARDGAVTGAMVVQELVWEIAPRRC